MAARSTVKKAVAKKTAAKKAAAPLPVVTERTVRDRLANWRSRDMACDSGINAFLREMGMPPERRAGARVDVMFTTTASETQVASAAVRTAIKEAVEQALLSLPEIGSATVTVYDTTSRRY